MKAGKILAIGSLVVASVFGFSLMTKAASPNNSTPILFTPDASSTTAVAGKIMNFSLVGFDLDLTDVLTYSATNLPTGATLNTVSGLFNWATTASQAGSYNINLTVSDGIDSNTIPVTLLVTSPVVTPPTSTPPKYHHGKKNDDKKEKREDKKRSERSESNKKRN